MSVEVPARVREMLARAGLGGLSDPALAAVCVAGLVGLGIGAWRFWPRGAVEELPALPDEPVASAEASASVFPTASTSAEVVVVHVVGAVMRPGVYRLPVGSRVTDAITAAGGGTGNAAVGAINLARVLADGEQVYLPTSDEVSDTAAPGAAGGAGGGLSPPGAGAPSAKIDINTATAAELDALPGVGPATAQKIVDDRAANGPFKTVEDLMRVSGIGQKKFDALKDLITAG
ncbi:MAG: ComEA family DNA-binding protein [Coriobacteriales bacterium]|nr:ComEA family DNA-binding protein [Actinomycetes bacterium]